MSSLQTSKGTPKGRKNEIGAKRLREERCSCSFSGLGHGGFCRSEQLETSGEPGCCISAPNLGNLVLGVVVLEFFIFFPPDALGQNVSGKNFPFSVINSQFQTAAVTVLKSFLHTRASIL